MKFFVLVLSLLLLSNSGSAQVDLSSYDTLHLEISMPDSDSVAESHRYMSGLLIGYLRGVESLVHVHEASDEARDGVLLRIDVTDIKVRGLFGALTGALSGKDKLTGTVSLIDLESESTLSETTFDGSGKTGFVWNLGGANIHTAIQNFSNSLLEWAGLGEAVIGKPQDWHGKVNRDAPISVQCSGITKKTAFQLKRNKQDDETLCAAVVARMQDVGVSVVERSATVLRLSLEAFGHTGSGKKIQPVLIMRWRIDGPQGAMHNDVLTSAVFTGEEKRKARDIMEELVLTQAHVGVDALWAVGASRLESSL